MWSTCKVLHQKHIYLQGTAFVLIAGEEIEREPGIYLFPFSCLGQCIVFYPKYVGLKMGVLASKILNRIWQPWVVKSNFTK